MLRESGVDTPGIAMSIFVSRGYGSIADGGEGLQIVSLNCD